MRWRHSLRYVHGASAVRTGGHEYVRPVLPSGQSDGAAGRTLDDVSDPRTLGGQSALQRPAAWSTPNVACAVVHAATDAGPRWDHRAVRRRQPDQLLVDAGREG